MNLKRRRQAPHQQRLVYEIEQHREIQLQCCYSLTTPVLL